MHSTTHIFAAYFLCICSSMLEMTAWVGEKKFLRCFCPRKSSLNLSINLHIVIRTFFSWNSNTTKKKKKWIKLRNAWKHTHLEKLWSATANDEKNWALEHPESQLALCKKKKSRIAFVCGCEWSTLELSDEVLSL